MYKPQGGAGLDISDADAAVTDVKTAKTFYSVAPPKKTGTYTAAPAQDIVGSGASSYGCSTGTNAIYYRTDNIGASGDLQPILLTQTYTAGSLAEAFGYILAYADTASKLKMRLFMGGTQVAESAYIATTPIFQLITLYGNAALSGSKDVLITIHNYDTGTQVVTTCGVSTSSGCSMVCGVFACSVKAV